MHPHSLFAPGSLNHIIRDPLGGIDVRFYEQRARIERNREIDSFAKWLVGRFTQPRKPMREG